MGNLNFSRSILAARKIAVNLPSKDENRLHNTEEGVLYQYIYPEGEALRYYFFSNFNKIYAHTNK